MNRIKDHAGLVGSITTAAGATITWLPVINEMVQLIAGVVAIVVGIVTIKYYNRKDRK
jgi:hypothetical protein